MSERPIDIQRIVREVLAELEGAGASATASQKQCAAAASALLVPSSGKPVVPSSGTPADAPLSSDRQLVLSCRVVTLAELDSRLEGIRRLVVAPGAVVTPAVREELQKRQIRLVSGGADSRDVVGPVRVALMAVGPSVDPEPLARTLQRDGAPVETERLDCLISACDKLAGRIASGGVLGVLLTAHTAAAMCLANRLPGVRAVLGVGAGSVAGDAASVGANLLVADPSSRGFFSLKQIIDRFVRGGLQSCPDVFKKRLT